MIWQIKHLINQQSFEKPKIYFLIFAYYVQGVLLKCALTLTNSIFKTILTLGFRAMGWKCLIFNDNMNFT